jgi:two-component system, response regulator PdtaR
MKHAQWHRVALVVDDEAFARLYAVQMLLDQHWCVLEAADAEEGLDMLLTHEDVSLLLTDISMPGAHDGLDLVERARHERANLPIVVTSGHGRPLDGRLPPDVTFLAKPYTAHALHEAIGAHEEEVSPGPIALSA